MSRPIAWGILGTGWMADRFAKTLATLAGAPIAAVMSRDPARAEAFKTRFGVLKAYKDESDLVNDPRVDVVYVATPNTHHFQACMLALNAGKAVLCEKPLAMNATETRAIEALAQARGLFCMEAMWTRFLPLYRHLEAVMAETGLGKPVSLHAELGHAIPFEAHGRFFNPALGGGALLDLGVYGISMATRMFGRPNQVTSLATLGRSGVDEQCSIFLKFPEGQASLDCSLVTPLSNEARVFCHGGGVRIGPSFIEAENLDIWRLSGEPLAPSALGVRPPSQPEGRGLKARLRRAVCGKRPEPPPLTGVRSLHFPAGPHRHAHQALETMRCLREGLRESPVLPLSDSVLVSEVMDAVRACWQQR